MTARLDPFLEQKLHRLATTLVDPLAGRVAIPPQTAGPGFWFGGGNLVQDDRGILYLVGRYRNAGDSRTGLTAGERGVALAIFRSQDRGITFERVLQLSKADLQVDDQQVLSIEGSALVFGDQQVELFVSTEKSGLGYPPGFESYLKPGTGVWTIDRLMAPHIEGLAAAQPQTLFLSTDPEYLHWKDPAVLSHAARRPCVAFLHSPLFLVQFQ